MGVLLWPRALREHPGEPGASAVRALLWIGVPEPDAADEARTLRGALIGRSTSRSVPATLNGYAQFAERISLDGNVSSAAEVTKAFAPWIVLSPETMFPGERVREAFGLARKLPPHVD